MKTRNIKPEFLKSTKGKKQKEKIREKEKQGGKSKKKQKKQKQKTNKIEIIFKKVIENIKTNIKTRF
jgi:hypothetical protein